LLADISRPSCSVRTDEPAQPGAYDQDVEQLSKALRRQVERAKARISDRYGKLVEERRSFEQASRREGSGQD
jgi:hypothetical protein